MKLHPFFPLRFKARVLEEGAEPGELVWRTSLRLGDVEYVVLDAGFSGARDGTGHSLRGAVLRVSARKGGVHVG